LLPVENYRLPFCQPQRILTENQSLGQFLMGDQIQSSPYVLRMKQDSFCEHLCSSNLGRAQSDDTLVDSTMVKMIRRQYRSNWIVENLPSGYLRHGFFFGFDEDHDHRPRITEYWFGFPVGFVGRKQRRHRSSEGLAYVHNHVNIHVTYRQSEEKKDGKTAYNILRLLVEPLSIGHMAVADMPPSHRSDDYWEFSGSRTYNITNPIESCRAGIQSHTSRLMTRTAGPQLAEGNVLFTYDVIWTEDREATWSTRWDTDLLWTLITYSMVEPVVWSAALCAILIRILRRGVTQEVPTDEGVAKGSQERGWKSVHADVFRPPATNPTLLAVMCGTGAQLLGTTISTVVLYTMGFISPMNRENVLNVGIFLFVAMGTVAGHVSSRYYKIFQGSNPHLATQCVAFGFPGMAFAVFLIANFVAWLYQSTLCVPFFTVHVLAVLWLAVCVPLVFLGASLGKKMDVVEFPVKTSEAPRNIPKQAWFKGVAPTLVVCGLLQFCCLYLQRDLAWLVVYSLYSMIGFLFLALIIVIAVCAELTSLLTYWQLCSEDYDWWWRAFANGGSSAIFFFLFSIYYFHARHGCFVSAPDSVPIAKYVVYFGYMSLASLALFMMMGYVGISASLCFNRVIFASIKFK
jgi:transmembrane 9 superfamily member 2/4